MISDIPSSLFSNITLEKPTGKNSDKPRMSDAGKCQSMVHLLIEADKERSIVLATVKGMLDGNAPFSHQALVKQGQANRTNVNFREGEAMLSSAETPYYDLFAESSTYFQVEVDERDPDKRSRYSRVITQHWDTMLKEWSGFDYNIQRIIHEMVGFGRGFCMWGDPVNWQFQAVEQHRVLVPNGTPADPDQLEVLIIRQSINVADLYGKIRDNEASRKVGWNPRAVLDAIAGAMPEMRNDTSTYDYLKVQEEMRNHDLYEAIRSDVVRLAHVFVREFSGKVSHLIVEERNAIQNRTVGGSQPKDVSKPKFLYKKIGRYNCFREVVGTFFFDIGDGTWHSVKGLGVKLYPFIEIKNRLNCSIVDNAFINMSVLMQAVSGKAEQETALMQIGPLTILPANLEVRQWGIAGRMEEGLVIEQALSNKLEGNTGQYRKAAPRDQGNPDTATKVNFDAIKEASLNKGAVNRFYVQLDNLGEEMFNRSVNFNLTPENNGRGPNCAALKFQQACIDDGVPKSCLKKIRFVRATRNSGNGSVFLRQQTVNQTAQLVPMMNEEGKQNWLDDSIAVLAGTENIARWNPKQMLNPSMQNDQAFAMIENDVLKDGSPVMVTSTQNAMVHSMTHMKAATEAINSIPQGGNPMQVLAFLEAVGPHIAQHLQGMANDQMRGREFKALSDQLKQLGQITDKLKAQVQQAQAQQQKQQEAQMLAMQEQQARTSRVLNDEQLRQLEVQNKLQLSREKADATMQMKRERQNQDLALKQQKAMQDLSLTDASVATDIRAKTAKTASDIENNRKKSSASEESD